MMMMIIVIIIIITEVWLHVLLNYNIVRKFKRGWRIKCLFAYSCHSTEIFLRTISTVMKIANINCAHKYWISKFKKENVSVLHCWTSHLWHLLDSCWLLNILYSCIVNVNLSISLWSNEESFSIHLCHLRQALSKIVLKVIKLCVMVWEYFLNLTNILCILTATWEKSFKMLCGIQNI